MTRGAAALLALALWSGCTAFGISTTPIRESNEGPVPTAFEGEETPALAPADVEGLFRAPALGPNVYYHQPADLWYRRAYRRWYQAFRWNGSWFILAETPEVLVGREIEKVELPEPPDAVRDDPRDLPELPELPELPDEEEEGFEPP
jgi:hypothetical protein